MSSRKKQTLTDRLRRLDKGCCPVHGTSMGQVGNAGALYVAECPRRDCIIRGTTAEPHGRITLLPQFAYLVGTATQVKLIDWSRRMVDKARHREFLENWQPQTMH